jgi:hypothetical protein
MPAFKETSLKPTALTLILTAFGPKEPSYFERN